MAEHKFSKVVACRGRSPYKSDMLRVDLIQDRVFLDARVAPTGLYNMGFMSIPADGELLRAIAADLMAMADRLDS